jgi:hypothetical protein
VSVVSDGIVVGITEAAPRRTRVAKIPIQTARDATQHARLMAIGACVTGVFHFFSRGETGL